MMLDSNGGVVNLDSGTGDGDSDTGTRAESDDRLTVGEANREDSAGDNVVGQDQSEGTDKSSSRRTAARAANAASVGANTVVRVDIGEDRGELGSDEGSLGSGKVSIVLNFLEDTLHLVGSRDHDDLVNGVDNTITSRDVDARQNNVDETIDGVNRITVEVEALVVAIGLDRPCRS